MAKVHQEVTFAVPPAKLYEALLSSALHAAFTGAPAQIESQTWRAANWAPGAHSLVRFELSPEGTGTKLVLDHDALADEQAPGLGHVPCAGAGNRIV